ncbi:MULTISPECIES: hypothetical protein [unclassified Yoonia]|uniref:hypothetical protein n=1 Tax=unclassified Yoonia TaxID=2629118 RepID=UPI002AFDCA72|nr:MULTISPECIES: hypothetical protein [unclassified Yoonia]
MADRTITGFFKPKPPLSVEDAYWGYIIRSDKGESLGFVMLQSASFLLGVGLLIGAVGMIALSPLVFGAELTPFRMAAAVLFGAGAAYLLWFASRGTQTEIQIDTSAREIREVIRNRAGRPSTVGTHDFDAMTDVFVQDDDESDGAMLVVQDGDSGLSICVAKAPFARLTALEDRIARDVLGDPQARLG